MCKHLGPRSSSTSVGSRLCPNYLWECFVVSAKVVATYSMGVVLVFTVRIRTILQLHPFGMFQGLFVRYREPALDIHHDDAIISDACIRSCIHITMVQPRLRRICTHAQARENLCNSPSQNMDADEHSNIN